MNTIYIVLPILILLMFDLGLVLKPSDFRLFVERPHAVLAGLAGQIILLPLTAWMVARAFGLEALFFLGVILVSCSPGGSSSNVFSMLAGGDVALSVSLTACSSVITLFTGPLIINMVAQSVGAGSGFQFPVGNLLVQNIVLMAVPIVCGLLIAIYREQWARRMHAVLKRLAFPLLVLLAGTFFLQHRATIVSEFPQLGLCMTVLILLSMGGGVLLAKLAKLSGKEQRTIIIEIGMQNAAQAITMACSPFVFNNEVIAIPAIIYALMMNIVLLIYVALVNVINGKATSV